MGLSDTISESSAPLQVVLPMKVASLANDNKNV
jgi:hypothetical protein